MTGLIILAAGESSRLGFPKQTLLYKGKTLLELETGIKSKCRPINVVLGANADRIESGVKQFGINIIHNADWAESMASSIRAGMKNLQDVDGIDGVVIMLCDQPFVTRAIIANLLFKQQETGKKIVACAYKRIAGVPILFNRALFNELLLLQGHKSAKKILNNHPMKLELSHLKKGVLTSIPSLTMRT